MHYFGLMYSAPWINGYYSFGDIILFVSCVFLNGKMETIKSKDIDLQYSFRFQS